MRGSNAAHQAYDENPSQHDKDGTQFFRLIHLICLNQIQPHKQQHQHFDALPRRYSSYQRELHNYALQLNMALHYEESLRYVDTESDTISDHDWSSIAFSKHTTSFHIPSLSDSSSKLLVNNVEYGRGMGRNKSAAREAAAYQALIAASQLQQG